MKRRLMFNLAGWLCLIAAVASFLYYWDPTRIYIMGLKSKNAFAFSPLPKEITAIDTDKLISIDETTDIEAKRNQLRNVILGLSELANIQIYSDVTMLETEALDKFPTPLCLFEMETARRLYCSLREYASWDNLLTIKEITVLQNPAFVSKVYLFRPRKYNGKFVLYHHGYAGSFNEQSQILKQFIEQGYLVAAFNIPSYGDHLFSYGDPWSMAINGKPTNIKYPLSIFFRPVIGTINYAIDKFNPKQISMLGLSAGAWVTAVSAALDPRISKSYPVAGVMPIALRHGDKERAAPQFYKPMLETASYLDIFTLAADSTERSQIQVFNRYDRCCFNNVRGKLYEQNVQKTLRTVKGGQFSVLIDETHARHKISSWAFDKILTDMEGSAKR